MSDYRNETPFAEDEDAYRDVFDVAADGLIISELQNNIIVEANPAARGMHGYTAQELVGLPLASLIHPESRDEFSGHFAEAEPGSNLYLGTRALRRDGTTFFAEWCTSPLNYRGRECMLSMVRDVSERMEAEQVLLRRAATHSREQAALLAISQALAATLELRPDWILEQLRGIINYTYAAFFSLEGPALVTLAMVGTPGLKRSAKFRIDMQGPDNVATLFGAHKPIRIADAWGESQPAETLRALMKDDAAALLEGMRSWMWVPLAVRGRILGGLGIAHERRDFFTPHHAELALSVANLVAITMVNADLYKNAQAMAALQERQRLAQNLHDAVNQSLFSAGLIAEVLPRIWDQGQDMAKQSLEELHKLTRGAMAEMRALLAELRPTALTDAELGDLVLLQANAFAGRTNIPAKVTIAGEGSLPPDVQVAIYRICQEAMNNIGKHAAASNVDITLRYQGGGIELNICDNGRGFDPQTNMSGHYGLSMMRERAEAVGVLLSVESQPGHGALLKIRWPMELVKETP